MNNPFSLRTEEMKLEIIKDMKTLELFFKEKIGLDTYLIYGTLLGAVREHDFIPHDADIDIAYLSKCKTKDGVKFQRIEIKKILKDCNMLDCDNTVGIKINCGNNGFDIWTSWIENDKYFILPRGNVCDTDIIFPLKPYIFRNEEFLIPNNSELLMDLLYRDWKNTILKEENYNKPYPLDFSLKRITK